MSLESEGKKDGAAKNPAPDAEGSQSNVDPYGQFNGRALMTFFVVAALIIIGAVYLKSQM